MPWPHIHLSLPDWVDVYIAAHPSTFQKVEDRMALVVELARQNVIRGTGGPFAAGVFELETGRLIAPGINMVVSSNCSVAHAEILALAIAQQKLGTFNLRRDDAMEFELVTSAEPCAMCLGAIPWSGVVSLVCGARDEDARNIGFDEGPKVADWVKEMTDRGIRVQRDLCREQAREVLRSYHEQGGPIYNGR